MYITYKNNQHARADKYKYDTIVCNSIWNGNALEDKNKLNLVSL